MYKLLFVGDDAHIVPLEVLGTPSAADRTTKGRMWASAPTGGLTLQTIRRNIFDIKTRR